MPRLARWTHCSPGVASAQRPRILVVEDDEGLLEIYRDFLADCGYEILLAANGEEALARLDARPDLVVLDLRMPVMDGHEFLRRLRADERVRDVPVLTVTGAVTHIEAGAATNAAISSRSPAIRSHAFIVFGGFSGSSFGSFGLLFILSPVFVSNHLNKRC